MTDPRLTPSNGRVADSGWEDRVEAQDFVAGSWAAVISPLTDLRQSPEGPRERQLLLGERFLVLEIRDGWAFGRADRDSYVGYVLARDLGEESVATHLVSVRSSHLYPEANIRSPEIAALSFGSRLTIIHEQRTFFETSGGVFVPKPHLRPIFHPFRDPVTVAQLFFGTPYLWGGNSAFGIDCSGLVQAALLACGIACPGDSDLQAALGNTVPDDAPMVRGDLIFWRGHVAMVVDDQTLIHANAHHMAVAYEPIKSAMARIEAQGGGAVSVRRRV